MEVCLQKAISKGEDLMGVKTNRILCIGCGVCTDMCPSHVRELSGREYSAPELFAEIEKDAAFYRRSGGGITVGGGEPTLKAEFTHEFLSLCRANFYHTAMETCALTPWEKLAPLLDLLDLVYIDLKHMDENRHVQWTGASNRVILENIRRAARQSQVVLRIPVIPGFNDSAENISASAAFAKELGDNILRLELLPYHLFGVHKYAELEREYPLAAIAPPADEHMAELRDIARTAGIDAEIGG